MTEQPENEATRRASGEADPPTSQDPAQAEAASPPHRKRFLIGTAFVLATVIGVFAVLAVWTNRQVLNTNNWTKTSTKLLENKQIQTAIAAYAVDQLFKSGEPQAAIKAVLPTQLQSLAGPASAGLQQIAGQAAPKLLASSQVQDAWRQANHAAHATLLKIIDGGGSLASTNNGVVTLNLHAIVSQLATSLGVQQQVAAAQSKLQSNRGTVQGVANKVGVTLPPSNGQLVVMRSNQLKTVQDVAGAIKGLALVLPLLTFALFILAVWLSKGHRQQALRMTGWCFVGIGLFVLLVRRLLGNDIVDSLVKNASNKPAAHDAWAISTTLLYDIAVALVAYGLVFVVAAWLAGRTRPARTLRLALAPTLRTRPVVSYAAVYFALLLVIVWGPTPATRQIAYILGFIVLLGVGVHALRRQTAAEYPDAQPGDAMRSIRSAYAERRRPPVAVVPASGASNGGRVAELERLALLHDRGSLTDTEFATEKAALINGP